VDCDLDIFMLLYGKTVHIFTFVSICVHKQVDMQSRHFAFVYIYHALNIYMAMLYYAFMLSF
jgi:hypothetical protein